MTRDLRVPMALIVSVRPRPVIVAQVGTTAEERRELLALQPDEVRSAGVGGGSSVKAWAATRVDADGHGIGKLIVADRRRRWFDDEEVRHLGLLGFAAAAIITDFVSSDLTVELDIRERRPVGTSLS